MCRLALAQKGHYNSNVLLLHVFLFKNNAGQINGIKLYNIV